MRTLLTTLLFALTALTPALAASTKLQKQSFKTHADCAAAGVSDANCFLGTDQLFDSSNNQTLKASIDAGILGGGGAVGTVNNFINKNNPDAEKGSTTGWTNSSGTFGVINTGQADGSYSFQFTTSASGQSVTSTLASIPALSYGKAGLARFTYQTSQSDWTIEVTDGTNILNSQILPATSGYQYGSVSFLMPSSGSVEVKIVSGTGAGEVITFDDVYLGENFQVSQISQAQLVGTAFWPTTASCAWTNTSSSWSNIGANSSCVNPTVTGSVVAPATKIPGVTMNNVGPGTYKVTLQGLFGQFSSSVCSFRLSDGTNNPSFARSGGENYNDLVGIFTYTTSQSSVTWQVQSKLESGAGGCQVLDSSESQVLWFYVEKMPSQSQTAVTPDTSSMLWQGNFTGVTGGWATSSSQPTFADFSAATGTVVLNQTTNVNLGTVSAAASSLPGITFTPSRAGQYQVCASGVIYNSNSSEATGIRLIDSNSNVLDSTAGATTPGTAPGSYMGLPFRICGYDYISAAGTPITFKVQGIGNGTSASLFHDSGFTATSGGSSLTFTIENKSLNIPGPVIQNQVTTSNSGGIRTFSARVGTTGTILSQLGSEFSSCSGGAGSVTCTVASGMCSSAMLCTCSSESASPAACSFPSVPTSTSVSTVTSTTNFYISCSCAK